MDLNLAPYYHDEQSVDQGARFASRKSGRSHARHAKVNDQHCDKLKYPNLNHYENSCGKIFTDGIQCQGLDVLAHLKHRPKVREAALSTVPTCGIGSSWISCVMDTCVKLPIGQCTNR